MDNEIREGQATTELENVETISTTAGIGIIDVAKKAVGPLVAIGGTGVAVKGILDYTPFGRKLRGTILKKRAEKASKKAEKEMEKFNKIKEQIDSLDKEPKTDEKK